MIHEADTTSCAEISGLLHEAKSARPSRTAERHGCTALATARADPPGRIPDGRDETARLGDVRAGGGRDVARDVLEGWGWAIPLAPLTVIATVGGVEERPVVREGIIVARPMLPMTLSFDHAVIDGAPAARFTATLRTLVETAAVFEGP